MKITHGLALTLKRPLLAAPAPGSTGSSPSLADRVDLSSGSAESRSKYRALAWAGFGVQSVGAALTLTGHGGLGVAVFAAGSAMIIYGELKSRPSSPYVAVGEFS